MILNTHPITPEMLNITGQSIKYPNSWLQWLPFEKQKDFCSRDVNWIFVSDIFVAPVASRLTSFFFQLSQDWLHRNARCWNSPHSLPAHVCGQERSSSKCSFHTPRLKVVCPIYSHFGCPKNFINGLWRLLRREFSGRQRTAPLKRNYVCGDISVYLRPAALFVAATACSHVAAGSYTRFYGHNSFCLMLPLYY